MPPVLFAKIKEYFIPHLFDLMGIVSGTLLALAAGIFASTNWAFIVFPGMMSIRGVIGGQFTGKMTSGLHIGFIKPAVRNNTDYFYRLISEVILLGFCASLLLFVFNSVIYTFAHGFDPFTYLQLFLSIQGTMAVSILVVTPITATVAILTFKKGLDPDRITYPMISSIADIMVSGVFILSIFLIENIWGLIVLAVFSTVYIIIALRRALVNFVDEVFVKEFKTSFSVIFAVALVVMVTGSILNQLSNVIGSRYEVYVIYPAVLTTVGDAGAMVGSTATTMLFTGEAETNASIFGDLKYDIAATWISSYLMFILFAIISTLIVAPLDLGGTFLWLMSVLTITNLLSIGIIVVVGLSSAIITFKKELNPDSFVIPLQTNIADLLATSLLAFAILLLI
ncbi:MAG: magnesium transporter [Candidatus Odinarchaeia archaeon]